jgi:hypothetical protein
LGGLLDSLEKAGVILVVLELRGEVYELFD